MVSTLKKMLFMLMQTADPSKETDVNGHQRVTKNVTSVSGIGTKTTVRWYKDFGMCFAVKGSRRRPTCTPWMGIGDRSLVIGGSMFTKKGFTLVELMIVVAIIGILAAIAIPNFVAMQYRAKRAEVPANVDGIKTAELAYDAAFDKFIEESSFQPDSSPGKAPRTWSSSSGFDTLGWGPDGEVRGSYKISSTSTTDFLVTGIADIDGDGTQSSYTCTKSVNAAMATGNDTY